VGIVLVTYFILAVVSAGDSCGKKNIDCTVTKKGEGYLGTVSKTKEGHTCQAWSSQSPNKHGQKTGWTHNYCRNPDGSSSLWCYTVDGPRWEFCDVRLCGDCDEVECGVRNIDCAEMDASYYSGYVNTTVRGYDCKDNKYCRGDSTWRPWCYTTSQDKRWDYCPIRDCEECDKIPDDLKKQYMALKVDGSEEYKKQVRKLLPQLLAADALKKGEVGIANEVTDKDYKYSDLALRTGEGVKTLKPKDQVVTINGTVTKKIGKRTYTAAVYRPTGLYAAPGDIITITIPTSLVGKIGVTIGQDDAVKLWFNPLTKAVNTIASPYGGLIIVYLKDIEATTNEGMFDVKIDNAVQAPYFSLGINSNEDWNKLKKYSPPFAVLRIPGQMHIYIQTKYLQTITDMVARMKDWKVTMDILDDLVGIPLNIQPGEEQFHYDPTRGGGVRHQVCAGGGKSEADSAYWQKFVDYKNKHPTVVFHELGHGYCYSDLPDMGGQWTAEFVREYIERKRNYEVGAKNFEFPFTILHQMVSFSKLSKGEACGVAKFPAGDDQSKTSFPYNDYFTCWTFLYRLPLWEFGWDVLRLVFTLDTESTTSYSSKTDRMADLYCQATKSNLVPLFEFYNIKISKSVADTCRKQKPPVMITNYIKIANCIMNKDIMECASLPEFPPYKGICRLSGVCNKHPDHDNKQITLNEEFDLWGGTTEPEFKRGLIDTTRNEKNCHGRAGEIFKWCKNEIDQSITASFTLKNGDSSSETFPPSGNCYKTRLSHYDGSSSSMTPEKCNEICWSQQYNYFGVRFTKECWCSNEKPSLSTRKPMAECNMPCSGDNSRNCGGMYHNNLWSVCMDDDCKFSYI